MKQINLLSSETIDKIAAGEVVERPLNVVKELVENAVDANSTAITVEIKSGGIEFIRVTDNGDGIERSQCAKAFLRHATSKLNSIEDLESLTSLGFRGEALSSISAVSKVEMVTKTKDSLLGTHISVEGGRLIDNSEIGAPQGTTIFVRQLFYNTPARKKFLKTPPSEGAMIEDILEKMALSHPEIAFLVINNGKTKLTTSGNGNPKDVVYQIFGKDVYKNLLTVDYQTEGVKIFGFAGKPDLNYMARNGEIFFVNNRYVKSKIVTVAIEEVFKKYLMQHQFPFCLLYIDTDPSFLDINVHPQKLEVRFSDNTIITKAINEALNDAFLQKELIPEVSFKPETIINTKSYEDFLSAIPETERKKEIKDYLLENNTDTVSEQKEYVETPVTKESFTANDDKKSINSTKAPEPFEINRKKEFVYDKAPEFVQESLFEKKLISDEALKEYEIVGQIFDTYWIITLDNDCYLVDQHAAHERVNYERLLNAYEKNDETFSQMINPPIVLPLSSLEKEALLKYMDVFQRIGFEIEEFGIDSFAIRSVPTNLFGLTTSELFHTLLNELMEKDGVYSPSFVIEKIASMACKASVKGGQKISYNEMKELMKEMMALENPYNCPHGRPTFIKITKTEIEKRFKRIV